MEAITKLTVPKEEFILLYRLYLNISTLDEKGLLDKVYDDLTIDGPQHRIKQNLNELKQLYKN